MVEASAHLFECEGAPTNCRPLRITARGCLDRQARVEAGWRNGDSADFGYSLATCRDCPTGRAVAKGNLPSSAKIVVLRAASCVPSPTRRRLSPPRAVEKAAQEALAAPQADHIVEPNKMVTPAEKPAPPAARPCDCGCGRTARRRSDYATRTCKILADRARYKARREAERRARGNG